MNTLILAAGYATRLYPLTENFPKPLLVVAGKTILDRILDDLDSSGVMSRYIIVSNHRYFKHFEEWKSSKQLSAPITILDDGSETNETRLGAVNDIRFAVDQLGLMGETLIAAGDNLLDFSLTALIDYYRKKSEIISLRDDRPQMVSCVMKYAEPDATRLKKCGVIEVDGDDQILSMEEKPACPKSSWAVPPFYLYSAEDLALIDEGLKSGCGQDAPGSFLAYLASRRPVYAMTMPGKRYDVGNLEGYRKICRQFEESNR